VTSLRRSSRAAQAAPLPEDCWKELHEQELSHGPGGWAGLASQRPSSEDRLSRLAGALERDIIPRLVRAHADGGGKRPLSQPLPTPSADEVVQFADAILAHDDPALAQMLSTLRLRGVGVEQLFTDLLAPTARRLGDLWDDDRCHFADVTIGLGRLQQIMRGLSSAFGTEIEVPAGGRRALLMPAPGEQHTFGLTMVAEFFARAGWEVAGVLDPLSAGFQDRVAQEWFDLVGISAGSSTKLSALLDCVAAVRRNSHNRAVVVMVGGPLFLHHPDLAAQVQADAVVTDGPQAPRLAEQLLGRAASKTG